MGIRWAKSEEVQMFLERIKSPADLRDLSTAEMKVLAQEIRHELVRAVSKSGGHLGSNLGIVELTIALHKVFESPQDKLIFDTGHQTYVHKMLTGRSADFGVLRQPGGLSGYPSRSESAHDVVENSHASTALSWADGIAIANEQTGQSASVVAVVGDGSLTGGMAWEAINNIANKPNRNLVIVVNDNGRSYSPTIGGLAKHLAALRTSDVYENVLQLGKKSLLRTPLTAPLYRILRGLKTSLQSSTQIRGMFQDLGLKYLGPVNGHDFEDLIRNLHLAKNFAGPVLVHVISEKGKGYEPAESDEAEKFHGVGKFDAETGQIVPAKSDTWTSHFSRVLSEEMAHNSEIVAITAAMLGPTGLAPVAERFPNRVLDVGIAEQHAITAAAGMAYKGLRPVVAVYASFLNRAFDQLLLDAALHREPVTVVLDRAGVTGDDGPSHNGIWDISLLGMVPGICVYAPWNVAGLKKSLSIATSVSESVSVIRFPKGGVDIDVQDFDDEISIGMAEADVVIIPVGVMLKTGLEVLERLEKVGVKAQLRAATQIQPIPVGLVANLPRQALVVTIEDGILSGGFGSRVAQQLMPKNKVLTLGVKDGFPAAANRSTILKDNGLESELIVDRIQEFL